MKIKHICFQNIYKKYISKLWDVCLKLTNPGQDFSGALPSMVRPSGLRRTNRNYNVNQPPTVRTYNRHNYTMQTSALHVHTHAGRRFNLYLFRAVPQDGHRIVVTLSLPLSCKRHALLLVDLGYTLITTKPGSRVHATATGLATTWSNMTSWSSSMAEKSKSGKREACTTRPVTPVGQ